MKEIKLELTLAEINQILEALGKKPFVDVYQLIQKIQDQAEGQVEKEDTAEEVPASTEA